MTEEGFTAQELVQACNKILVYAGLVARVANIEEARVVCSSTGLFVAALEGFLQQRLEDVFRVPSTPAERAYNNNIVVDVLSQILNSDLSHISGERLVEGSVEDISNLIELLAALCHGRPLQGPPSPEQGADVAALENGAAAQAHAEGPSTGSRDATEQKAEDDGTGPSDHSTEVPESWLQRPQDGSSDVEARRQEQQQQNASSSAAVGAAASGLRRKSSGRRSSAAQRAAGGPWQPAPGVRPPLSPIQEVSREGWDHTALASKGTPGVDAARPAPPRGRAAPGPPPARFGPSSSGGASSVISIPSDVREISRRESDPSSSAYQPSGTHFRPETSLIGNADEDPSSISESTTTLLERALWHAEATLRGLGQEYEDLYYDDEADEGRRARSRARSTQHPRARKQVKADGASEGTLSKGSGAPEYKTALRALRAQAWPDGREGSVQQHKSFLRRAKRALAGEMSVDSTGVPPTLASGLSSSQGSRSAFGVVTGGARRSAGPGASASMRTGAKSARRQQGVGARGGEAHTALLRVLHGNGVAPSDAARQGRKLLQRTAASYGSTLPVARRGATHGRGIDGPIREPKPGMHLSADLESKLRYVYRLAMEHPKQRAARDAIQSLELTDERLRQVRRREMVDRLSSARARRDAALRLTADRLHEQGLEYDKRVEQLRLQRLAAEWNAKQRSAQMQRALQAELALRETFMEVLEGEKEVLLAERQDAKASAAFPKYKSTMRMVEHEYLAIFRTLEDILASERQQRVRANRETMLAHRQGNQLAAAVVQNNMEELLGRVSREEEAILKRHSFATRPQSKQALVAQIRRLLGLS